MKQLRYAAGEKIFSEGDASSLAYLIWSGRVEVLKETPDGAQRIAILMKDDFLGEMGLIDELPRSATARALDDVVCSAIDKDEFLDMLMNRPDESLALLRVLFDRLRSMNQELAALQQRHPTYSTPPEVTLFPLTDETAGFVPADGLPVHRFPFRIGRKPEGDAAALLSLNELEIPDQPPYCTALNHLLIDFRDNRLVIVDRGSRFQAQVNGTLLGRQGTKDSIDLAAGDNEIHLGDSDSPYRLRVQVSSA